MNLSLHNQDCAVEFINEDKFLEIITEAGNIITADYQTSANQELSVCLIPAENMQRLNEKFVNHEGVTDVITFDYRDDFSDGDDDEYIGEVYVCPDVALQRSSEFNNDFTTELITYIAHGMLHLFGYDDKTDEDQQDMSNAEARVISQLRETFQTFENLVRVS